MHSVCAKSAEKAAMNWACSGEPSTKTCGTTPREIVAVAWPPHGPLQTALAGRHGVGLQSWTSTAPSPESHCVPPSKAGVEILNCRLLVPPPHSAEHSPNSLQLPTQSVAGHAGSSQGCVSVVAVGHAAPPFAAGCVTENTRDCVPLPHETVQPSHSPHVPTQSTGHGCVLHCCDSVAPEYWEHWLPVPTAATDT